MLRKVSNYDKNITDREGTCFELILINIRFIILTRFQKL